MNYSFEDANERKPVFPLGESVEGVKIAKVEYNTLSSEKGDFETIEIVLKAPNGGELSEKIFPVNPDWISPRSWIEGDTKEQAVEDAHKRLMTRLLHFATKLGYTKDQLNKHFGENNSFKRMAQLYSKLMNKAISEDNPELYVKTIVDKNGYTALPKYPSGFLQRMDDGESTLQYTENEKINNAKRSKSTGVSSTNVDIEDDEDLDDLDL